MTGERFVVDTNVLISASLTPSGPPRMVVDQIGARDGTLLFCDETFAELKLRLCLSRFDPYVGREVRLVFLAQIEDVAEWVSISGAKLGCRDPDDDKMLETALLGRADCLITGDRDLLVMSPFRGISILSPTRALGLQ